jgi:hypothetical protein
VWRKREAESEICAALLRGLYYPSVINADPDSKNRE